MFKFIFSLSLSLFVMSTNASGFSALGASGTEYPYTISVSIQNSAAKDTADLVESSNTNVSSFPNSVPAQQTSTEKGAVTSEQGADGVEISANYGLADQGTCGYQVGWKIKQGTVTYPTYTPLGNNSKLCRVTTKDINFNGSAWTADITVTYMDQQ